MKKIITTIASIAIIAASATAQSFSPVASWTHSSEWYAGINNQYWETIDDASQGSLSFTASNIIGNSIHLALSIATQQGQGGGSKKSSLEIRVGNTKYVTITSNDGTTAGNNVTITTQQGATSTASTLYIASSGFSAFQDVVFTIPYTGTTATITILSKPTGSFINAGDDWRVKTAAVTGLPIKLVSFTGMEQNGMVRLHWETAEEKNFDHFELQASANGSEWESIATISGKGDNSQYDYTTLDIRAYFRLKMIDVDETTVYSKVVALYGKQIANTANQPTIIYDMSGKIVAEPTQPGIYIMRTGNTVTKILK